MDFQNGITLENPLKTSRECLKKDKNGGEKKQ